MAPEKVQEAARVVANRQYRGDYFILRLHSPEAAARARAGQFVDILMPNSPHLLLRRPFSIFDTDPDRGELALMFKRVGAGTALMAELAAGQEISLLGPLGKGFPPPTPGQRIILVAGGYGSAATYLIAKHAERPGVVLLGGRSAVDVLLQEEFAATGFTVRISTNDGSLGHQGLVTELLAEELAGEGPEPVVYACGPNPMLKAVAAICGPTGIDPWVSVDMPMCCGVGACFACVVKVHADTADGWEYVRTCREGPVFRASRIVWEALA